LPYTVPVTNRKPFDFEKEDEEVKDDGVKQMRIDWVTINRVVESVRNRIYDLALPTERENVISRYNLDDPIREKLSVKSITIKLNEDKNEDLTKLT
jgi:hypothetical protein